MRSYKTLLSILLAFLVGFNSTNPVYKNLKGVSFSNRINWDNSGALPKVSYAYYGQDEALKVGDIIEVTRKVESAIINFSYKKSLPLGVCRKIENIDIYYVHDDILNDKKIFPFFSNKGLSPKTLIWGAYDPVVGTAHYAAIIISNRGEVKTEETMAHELFHFWYDNFCWEQHMSGDPEEAALMFESFYERNYM